MVAEKRSGCRTRSAPQPSSLTLGSRQMGKKRPPGAPATALGPETQPTSHLCPQTYPFEAWRTLLPPPAVALEKAGGAALLRRAAKSAKGRDNWLQEGGPSCELRGATEVPSEQDTIQGGLQCFPNLTPGTHRPAYSSSGYKLIECKPPRVACQDGLWKNGINKRKRSLNAIGKQSTDQRSKRKDLIPQPPTQSKIK